MKLKKEFKKYFWEYDFENLCKDTEKYKRFIAERLLVFGDMKSVKWLKQNFTIKQILHIIKTSRNIDKITKNYWLTLYDRK
jgi:hypothetical protein